MHPLTAHPLPGLDAHRLQRLQVAGLANLEDLVDAGPERLSALTDFDAKTCRALLRVAEAALDRTGSAVIPLTEREESGNTRLGRGLNAARRIERTHALLRQVASMLPATGVEKASWRRALKKARRQLAKLEHRLTLLQQALLAEGVSVGGDAHLRNRLDELEQRLFRRAGEPAGRRAFKRVGRAARDGRKALADR